MVGEDLPEDKVSKIYKNLKTIFDYVLVIGTTLEYPYLRFIINKAKQRGSKIIHINPDPEYNCHIKENYGGINRSNKILYRGNEEHWELTASMGLRKFRNEYIKTK